MRSKVIMMITKNILSIPFHIISRDIKILLSITGSFRNRARIVYNNVVKIFKIIPPANTDAICPDTFAPIACIRRWFVGSSLIAIF